MGFFARKAAAAPVATPESAGRKTALEDYFASREVYRGEQGCILVDAFRFVGHNLTYTPTSDAPALLSYSTAAPQAAYCGIKAHGGRSRRQSDPRRFYFLSHFHSDHYTGIQSSWHSYTIYCSRPTAALTQSELGVSAACLFPMDMNMTYIFSLQTGVCRACVAETPLHPRVQAMLHHTTPSSTSTTSSSSSAKLNLKNDDTFAVRLIPANHCPGAAIFLFASPLFGTVVHTGDFRFNGSQRGWRDGIRAPGRRTYVSTENIRQQALRSASPQITDVPPLPLYEQFIEDDAALQEVAAKEALDVLFLDNTFCEPPYRFPTQWAVTQTVVEVLHSLLYRAAERKREAAAAAMQSSSEPRHGGEQLQLRTSVRCAVLIGCYTIGKERVALAIRDAFSRAPSTTSPSARAAGESGGSCACDDKRKHDSQASWHIYVSPTRYSMLTAMDFFPGAFQPLLPSAVKCESDGSGAAFAAVEDTPVQLPVLLHSAAAQRVWEEAQVSAEIGIHDAEMRESATNDGKYSTPSAPIPPTTRGVRRNLSADFSTQLPDAPVSPSLSPCEGEGDATQYLLSVFLVPMGSVGYQPIAALAQEGDHAALRLDSGLKLDLAPYDSVLFVEPTGWCKRCATRDINRKLTLLKVPYSEHCGFHEMLDFVQFVNPARVVPTVSADNYRKHEALFVEKAPRLRSRVSNVQPITRFFSSGTLQGSHHNSSTTPVSTAVKHESPTKGGVVKPNAAAVSQVAQSTTNVALADVAAPRPISGVALEGKQARRPLFTLTSNHEGEPPMGKVPANAAAQKRKRPQSSGGDVSVEATGVSSTAHTLDRLFQRIKVGDGRREAKPEMAAASSADVSRHHGNTESRGDNDGDDDEDCQVIRAVQTVVEISDDD
jgi:hypothetical protein